MNKTTLSVHDRRVRRTHHAVIDALVELVHEKGYDAITVQDLLNRADIGRSTFYGHYRGKDDLLLTSFGQMLGYLDASMGNDERRVAPVRELFGHVGEFDTFHRSLARAHMRDRVYQAGTNQLGVTIARRLAALRPRPGDAPLAAVAQAWAGALFALLRWWLDHDRPYNAQRMDELYHGLLLR